MTSPSEPSSSMPISRAGFVVLAILMVLSLWGVLFQIDLTPRVESDFFFSSEDPAFQASLRIAELFPTSPQLILSAKGPDISSPEYIERIGALTEALLADPDVEDVQSLTRGPSRPDAVADSPIWSRLLLTASPNTTQLVVSVDGAAGSELIARLEALLDGMQRPSFDLQMSGVPYVVELIRRHLKRDLRLFSVAAFLVFGLVIALLYRSVPPVVGTLLSCLGACVLTLMTLHLLGTPIGILTANIATIVFVLTLSHTVFLTGNWRRVRVGLEPDAALARAVRITFTASFWCMVAALSGFGSLLLANAKPLRELGISGMVGTTVAIVVAYGFYPFFLRSGKAPAEQTSAANATERLPGFLGPVLVAVLVVVSAVGLRAMDTDPSVFAYFGKNSEIRSGLEHFDRAGGSSPLLLTVSDPEDGRLDTNAQVGALAQLQARLEEDPAVGSALSLSPLLAEARRVPFAGLLPAEQLVNILSSERYNNIARSFITEDRQQALFFLRMRETGRNEPRREVVARLAAAAPELGLQVDLVGGLYDLQGKLGELVSTSVLRELGGLLAFFVLVAAAVSRSTKTTLAMVVCLAAVPVVLLGAMGHLRQPVDVISAPGANVAIALGIDAMIHLVMAVRRQLAAGAAWRQAWQMACSKMRRPVVSAMLILAAGFGIFALSSFPPTQRFGLMVAAGTLISAVMALIVLPYLAVGKRQD